MYICVDFDGTAVKHAYPEIGEDAPGAVDVLKKLVKRGDRLILFTMRSGDELEAAKKWFEEREIPLYGINKNPTQTFWTKSPKAYGNIYIDDAALGCPLIKPTEGRPYADWETIEKMLFS